MKKTIVLIGLFLTTLVVSAQVKANKAKTPSASDTIHLPVRYVYDTVKILFFYPVEDNVGPLEIRAEKGYLVTKKVASPWGQFPPISELVYDKNWVIIRKEIAENVYDIKAFNWK